MAKTKISELGSRVSPQGGDRHVGMLADGAMKAGNVVSNNNGTVAGVDTDSGEDYENTFIGIQKERFDTDLDSIPTAGVTVDVIYPEAGKEYNIIVVDLNASGSGIPLGFHTTAGVLTKVAAVESHCLCRTLEYEDGDTVAKVIWGAA